MPNLPFKTTRSDSELASKRQVSKTPSNPKPRLTPFERRMREDWTFLRNRFRQKRIEAERKGRTEQEMLGLVFSLSRDEWIELWREVIPRLPEDFPENGLKNLNNPYVLHLPAYEFRSKGAIKRSDSERLRERIAPRAEPSEAGYIASRSGIAQNGRDKRALCPSSEAREKDSSDSLTNAPRSPQNPPPATPVPPEGLRELTEAPTRSHEGYPRDVGSFKRQRGDNSSWVERGELTPGFKLQLRKIDPHQPFQRGNLQLVCVHIGDRKLKEWGERRRETVIWRDTAREG